MLAVDVGGTKLAAALVEPGGSIVVADRVATPDTDRAEEVFGALAALIAGVRSLSDARP